MGGTVKATGLVEVTAKLRRLGERLRDPRPILEAIELGFYEVEVRQFDSLGQGQWPPLSERYRRWKERAYPGKPLMVREGDLREGLTQQGGAYQVRRLGSNTLELGTSRPGAAAHQSGKVLPLRKVIDVTPADEVGWLAEAEKQVRETIRRVGLG